MLNEKAGDLKYDSKYPKEIKGEEMTEESEADWVMDGAGRTDSGLEASAMPSADIVWHANIA
jgi:hypothetical protein